VTSVESARHQWEEGQRRLADEERDAARAAHLALLVDAVTDELRRRVGRTFTVAELAQAYDGAEEWVRQVVADSTPSHARAGVRDTALVQDVAFGRYVQGASDYRP
jgi:hypothetical protein